MAALDPSSYIPNQSLSAKVGRRLTQWKAVAPLPKTVSHPMISFTFDDFPISAAENGSAILGTYGAKGTFYTCTGLEGLRTKLGQMFTADTLQALSKAGHHIAAHSHSHVDCSIANVQTIKADLTRNLVSLRDYIDPGFPCHYAWPFGETQTDIKQDMKPFLSTGRGKLHGINRKGSDRVQLRAYEITADESTIERAEHAIEKAVRTGGWVIIYTHDVRKKPSPIGTNPSSLRYLVNLAHEAGLNIVSMQEAYATLKKEMALD